SASSPNIFPPARDFAENDDQACARHNLNLPSTSGATSIEALSRGNYSNPAVMSHVLEREGG
ncbi:unnamed protein product, partial [Amoebophrya sp. A25]